MAERETRTVTVQEGNPWGVPGDEYALVESYCTDPGCDCRRVMLNVLARQEYNIEGDSFEGDKIMYRS